MATLVDQDFHARLRALGDKFAARVPETMAAIERALAACAARGATPECVGELHELLHGIAGSAGTFGFTVLGREARRLEQQARAVQAGEVEWPPLAAQLAQLLRWAARDPKAAQYDGEDEDKTTHD
ncbi:Hpt domain-containing protein [Rugamonas sp.]|uniref:Hpt domain-containing protein n=1 Tax=Rugamonas sp. TaxID=1926287 RepID=UPI0025FF3CF9|nr:Hpt domain-containing protein [Rugamonas sp.]